MSWLGAKLSRVSLVNLTIQIENAHIDYIKVDEDIDQRFKSISEAAAYSVAAHWDTARIITEALRGDIVYTLTWGDRTNIDVDATKRELTDAFGASATISVSEKGSVVRTVRDAYIGVKTGDMYLPLARTSRTLISKMNRSNIPIPSVKNDKR
jgi:hypothetical protein